MCVLDAHNSMGLFIFERAMQYSIFMSPFCVRTKDVDDDDDDDDDDDLQHTDLLVLRINIKIFHDSRAYF